jgi:hypothetical protein
MATAKPYISPMRELRKRVEEKFLSPGCQKWVFPGPESYIAAIFPSLVFITKLWLVT